MRVNMKWRKVYFLWFLPQFLRMLDLVLAATDWKVVCDLLKFACGTTISKRKIIWPISSIKSSGWNVFNNKRCTYQSVYSKININYQKNVPGVQKSNSILYVKCYCGHKWKWLLAERWGTYGQNAVNVILSLSGPGSARITQKTEFSIFGLNQKLPHITLHKHLIYPRTHEIILTKQKYKMYSPKTKHFSPVASSINAWKTLSHKNKYSSWSHLVKNRCPERKYISCDINTHHFL